MGQLNEDLNVIGNLSASTFTCPAGAIDNTAIKALAKISSTKLGHRNTYTMELFGPAVSVAALTKWVCAIRGATGTIVSINAYTAVQATGADRTIDVDLQKSTGAGAFATVLSVLAHFTNATAVRTAVPGTITTPGLVVGDLLEVIVTVAGAAGAQATGLTCVIVVDEDAA